MVSRRSFLGLLGGGTATAGGVTFALRALREGTADPFPTVRYGQESCSFCGMGIGDARYAAAWRAATSERHFDDIGCMVNAYRRDHPAGEVRLFVHDFHSEAWIDAEGATFVVSPAIKSPMAYGVFAVSDGAGAATSTGHEGVSYYAWSELLEHLESRG